MTPCVHKLVPRRVKQRFAQSARAPGDHHMETEHGKSYGLHNLPSSLKAFEMEFDMGLVEQVHQADRTLVTQIIEYVVHHIALDDPTTEMHTVVGKDPDDPLAVVYQLQSRLPLTVRMNDMHCDLIKHGLGPVNCVTGIEWVCDLELQRVLLMINIRSLLSRALQIKEMDIMRIHARMQRAVTYESDGRSGSTKRTRLEKG